LHHRDHSVVGNEPKRPTQQRNARPRRLEFEILERLKTAALPRGLQSALVSATACSINGVAIRLTEERWLHITEQHSELAGYFHDVLEAIESPEAVYAGSSGELLAARPVEPGKYLYKEQAPADGFVITAFLTRRLRQLEKRAKLWPR